MYVVWVSISGVSQSPATMGAWSCALEYVLAIFKEVDAGGVRD